MTIQTETRMWWAITAALLLFAGCLKAFGQEVKSDQIITRHLELLVIAQKGDQRATFELGNGGCLIGPLTFYDLDGKEQFKLAAGVEFPTGCRSLSKKTGE